jgi:alpha/beta superfamily hydrolase
MVLIHPTPVLIDGPVGKLEGLLGPPESLTDDPTEIAPPRAIAVVCHPHPSHGGTMHNTVAYRVAKGLRRAGIAVLRFNFRGVENSEGEHHGEGHEEEDARAAIDFLMAKYPSVPLWAGGFSFGSRTIAGLAPREPRIERVFFIALPVSVYECEPITTVKQPGLMLFAGADEFGTARALREKFPHLGPHLEVDEIPGTDHFFRGKTPVLEERVRAWAQRSLDSTD